MVLFCVTLNLLLKPLVSFSRAPQGGPSAVQEQKTVVNTRAIISAIVATNLVMGPVAAQTSAPRLPPLQRPRLLHQAVLVAAHREQVEQHLEAPLVEVLAAPEALLVEVLEGQRELEVPQAQVGLPALELLRVRLERWLEQSLP